jgi:flagellar biosynthetic protein FliO
MKENGMSRMRMVSIGTAALVFVPGILQAEPASGAALSIGRLFAAFIAVIVLIYATVYVFRKVLYRGQGRCSTCIRPVGTFPLGQKARLSIVEVGGRAFLLAVTDHSVSSIAEFDPSELDGIRDASRVPGFFRLFQGLSKAYGAKESSTG